MPISFATFKLLTTLSSNKSLIATTSTPSNFAIDFKCPLPLAPSPINATLTVSIFRAEKPPIYLPFDTGITFGFSQFDKVEAAVNAAAENAVVFINFLLL